MKFSQPSLRDCAGLGGTLCLLAANGFAFFARMCQRDYGWAVLNAAATLSMAYWVARYLTDLRSGQSG